MDGEKRESSGGRNIHSPMDCLSLKDIRTTAKTVDEIELRQIFWTHPARE